MARKAGEWLMYAPINVRNPISLHHLAKVWPRQSIVLSLDANCYPNARVLTNSDFLRVEEKPSVDNEKLFHITQVGELDVWAKYSSCFLGEVWISSDVTVACLFVVLQSFSVSKADHLTIINPNNVHVRIRPYQILELVVYDQSFGYQDEWTWLWDAAIHGLGLDLLGVDHLTVFGDFRNVSEDEPEHQYARCPRVTMSGDNFCRQHHFWFRFNSSILDALLVEKDGELLGELTIRGCDRHLTQVVKQIVDFKVNICADLKRQFRGQVIRTLGVLSKNADLPVPRKYNWPVQKAPVSVTLADRIASTFPVSKKQHLPFVKEVSINRLGTAFEDGCKTVDAMPPERHLWNQFHDEEYYFVENNYIPGMPKIKYGSWGHGR